MSSSNADVLTLVELGLSISQANIFLTLTKNGTLPARDISSLSGINRSHVYQALTQLVKAGLVIRIIGQPEQFQAIDLKDCLSYLMEKRMEKTLDLEKKTKSLRKKYGKPELQTRTDQNIQFAIIPGKNAFLAKTQKMIEKTKENILFQSLPRRIFSWMPDCTPVLEKKLKKNITIKMMLPGLKRDTILWRPLRRLIDYSNFYLKLTDDDSMMAFSVWDQKEVLVATSAVDSAHPASTLWSNNVVLVNLTKEHFSLLWDKAEEVTSENFTATLMKTK